MPAFGADPRGWFEALEAVLRRGKFDVLFPTHEQVPWLAAFRQKLAVKTAVPSFDSLRRVQGKLEAFRTLAELGLPQPRGSIVSSAADLRAVSRFPVYVKRQVSTASTGVRRADDAAALARLWSDWARGPVLAQDAVSGPLAMVQAVSDEGRLVCHHACVRLEEGVGGGASRKVSTSIPSLPALLEVLVGGLRWHGPISLDVVLTSEGPMIIDVNPRLVEPMNAWLSGVDLVEAVLEVAQGKHPRRAPEGRPGVRTRQLLLEVLAAARSGGRRALLSTLRATVSDGAIEELTPIANDWRALLPVAVVTISSLVSPESASWFSGSAIDHYSLTREAWEQLEAEVDRRRVSAHPSPSVTR